MSVQEVPADLIPDLLSRLPIKTVCKFKSVSKLWRSIIEDRKFCSMHANLSRVSQICLRKYVVGYMKRVYKICEIKWSGFDIVIEEFDSLLDEISNMNVRLIGSSNGVLCLLFEDENNVILWNPLSGKFKCPPPLPKSRHPNPTFRGVLGLGFIPRDFYTYGFGYDKVNDDYKVVCFEKIKHGKRAFVYSRKLNKWRIIEAQFPIPSEVRVMGVLSEGALHWIHEGDYSLIAFNLSTEEFKHFPMPRHEYAHLWTTREGRLCQILRTVGKTRFVFRLMLSYDDWQEFSLELHRDYINRDPKYYELTPISYVERPKQVLVMMHQLGYQRIPVSYDLQEQLSTYGEALNINGVFDREVFPYIQTLEL